MEATGYATGVCPHCGRRISRPRPARDAVCDCYMYCPYCGAEMTPAAPDLDAANYRVEDVLDPSGAAEMSGEALDTLYRCPSCGHRSSLKPQVVDLT